VRQEFFFVKVIKGSFSTLAAIIGEKAREGFNICSCNWCRYKGAGFKHLKVYHKNNFVDHSSGRHMQNVGIGNVV
jgi:hypothetical protein